MIKYQGHKFDSRDWGGGLHIKDTRGGSRIRPLGGLRGAVREREIPYVREIMLAPGPSRPIRPTSTSVLIRTYVGFYLEYKHNIGIVGKLKMSSSLGGGLRFNLAEAPPKTS